MQSTVLLIIDRDSSTCSSDRHLILLPEIRALFDGTKSEGVFWLQTGKPGVSCLTIHSGVCVFVILRVCCPAHLCGNSLNTTGKQVIGKAMTWTPHYQDVHVRSFK